MSYLPPPQKNWLITGIQLHPPLFMILARDSCNSHHVGKQYCQSTRTPDQTNDAFLDWAKGKGAKFQVAILKALVATATGELINQWHPVTSVIVHDLLPKKRWMIFERFWRIVPATLWASIRPKCLNPRSNKQPLLPSNHIKGLTYLPPPQENWLISGIQSHPSLFTICCLKKDEWTLQQQNKQKIKYLYVRIALRSQYV